MRFFVGVGGALYGINVFLGCGRINKSGETVRAARFFANALNDGSLVRVRVFGMRMDSRGRLSLRRHEGKCVRSNLLIKAIEETN